MNKFWYAVHDLLGFPAIVKFRDGTFGVRRLVPIGYKYLDLTNKHKIWWGYRDGYMRDCKGTLEQAAQALALLKEKNPKDSGSLISLRG